MNGLSPARVMRRNFDGRKGRVYLLPSVELSGVGCLITCQLLWATRSLQRAGSPIFAPIAGWCMHRGTSNTGTGVDWVFD